MDLNNLKGSIYQYPKYNMSPELEYKFVHALEMEKRFSRKATKVFLECRAGRENTGKENIYFFYFPVFPPLALHPKNGFLPLVLGFSNI